MSGGGIFMDIIEGMLANPKQIIPAFLLALGIWKCITVTSNILSFTWRTFLRPGLNLKKKYEGWAIVTGATDGIGLGYAKALARQGFPLLIISRTESKLKAVSKELEECGAPEVEYLVLDFASAEEGDWETIEAEVAEKDVGILINNVGVSYNRASYLHELEPELIEKLIKVNCGGMTHMTRCVLPGMVERKKRSLVLNVGSGVATVLPSDPLYTVYAGTKAYVDKVNDCLANEYKEKKIDFSLQAPLYVSTKMAQPGRRRVTTTIPSPDDYAKAGLRRAGQDLVCTPYWSHSLQAAIINMIPTKHMNAIRLKQTKDLRRRALAKAARKTE